MQFMEAVSNLENGKYVARGAWDHSGEYIVLMPGMQYIWKIMTIPNPNAGNWIPLMSDIMADDWKVVERKKVNEILDNNSANQEDAA
jgi:hypothetical protein